MGSIKLETLSNTKNNKKYTKNWDFITLRNYKIYPLYLFWNSVSYKLEYHIVLILGHPAAIRDSLISFTRIPHREQVSNRGVGGQYKQPTFNGRHRAPSSYKKVSYRTSSYPSGKLYMYMLRRRVGNWESANIATQIKRLE